MWADQKLNNIKNKGIYGDEYLSFQKYCTPIMTFQKCVK